MQRQSYIFSASLHAGILAVGIFGLPYWWEKQREPEPMVVLAEFAPIAEKTNVPKPQPQIVETKAPPKEEPAPEAKPAPEPPKPQPQAAAPPPPPPPPTPEPPKQAEAPKPAPMPEPQPTAKPLPKPKEVVETPEPPKVAEKPKPEVKPAPPKPTQQRTEEKSKTPNFSDVAALVNKMKAPPAPTPQQAPQTASRTPPAAAPRAEGPSDPTKPISMSEEDFIRKQVEDKWQFDIGAKDAQNLLVKIRFSLNADGSLRQQPEIVDTARMYLPGQESYRSAAESAKRAVLKAAPFQLPPGDRDKWSQEIILIFDPRMMVGG